MAGSTPYFGLSFFDFGDKLDAPLNVQKEIDRFLVIDKQLYAIYSIFGDGVIDGWVVEDNGFTEDSGISITISPGLGIIRFIASSSDFPSVINGLPPNSTVRIYAVLQGSTAENRAIDFTYDFGTLGESAILLAEVVTGQAAVVSINNNVRELIGFEAIIRDQINQHKHRGTPTKIDLRTETRNQLPGARIESVDADKITSGVFDIERVPLINHEELDYNGLLTHAELDSFVKTLTSTNKQLLGEVTTVNMLKHILFMKYKYADIDEYFINELAVVPGITPDSFIDLEATTAYVSNASGCISGRPPNSGEFVDITWDSQTSLSNAHKLTNVTVRNGLVTLERDDSAKEMIENFENVSGSGDDIPGFTKTTEILFDEFKVISESTTTLHTEGFYGGKFSTERRFRALFTKTLSSRDWSNFNQLVVNIKSLSVSHGPVFCYFVNGTGESATKSSVFLLLSSDEATDNPDAFRNDFAERVFTITSETRSSVTSFVIFTDDTTDNFEFYLDEVYVENTALFKPQGTITLRYTSASELIFYALFYSATTPSGTSISAKIKAASSSALLPRAAFTSSVYSGNVVALPGSDAEIEITLLTSDKTITPTLDWVKLRLLADSETHGFNIQNQSDWALGDSQNVSIIPVSGDLSQIEITTPINVGGISFSYLQAVREIDDSNVSQMGFSGVGMPVSPPQALDWINNPVRRFSEPVSIIRRFDKNFIIADKNNDRVLLCDSTGKLVKGFGSVNVTDNDFYPMIVNYNPTSEILTVVLSKPIETSTVNLEKMSLFLGASELPLTASDTVEETADKTSQIINIVLTSDKTGALVDYVGDLFMNFDSGAFPTEIEKNKNAETLIGIRGIRATISDFTFMNGISHPICVNILENGDWIVCNSSIKYVSVADGETGTEFSLAAVPTSVSVTSGSTSTTQITGGVPPYDIKTGPNTGIATASFSGDVLSIQGVAAGNTSVVVKDSSMDGATPSPLTLSVPVTVVVGSNTQDSDTSAPPILQFNPDTQETVWSSDSIQFSDFSLGGLYEMDDEKIVFAGIYQDPATITTNTGTTTSTTVGGSSAISSSHERFRLAAIDGLKDYRGIVGIINKVSNNMIFKYLSPDGLYASDIDVNEDGNFVVSESSFAGASGRVIVLDDFGNIIRSVGNKQFNAVNDAKAVGNGHLLLSV